MGGRTAYGEARAQQWAWRIPGREEGGRSAIDPRLSVPGRLAGDTAALPAANGALTIFAAKPIEHLDFGRHLLAEQEVQEYIAGRGVVSRWVQERRANHWGDSTYVPCILGHFAGCRLDGDLRPGVQAPKPAPVAVAAADERDPEQDAVFGIGGRPFSILDR